MEKMIKAKKAKGNRKHGFLVLMATNNGKKTIRRRRAKNRKKLTR